MCFVHDQHLYFICQSGDIQDECCVFARRFFPFFLFFCPCLLICLCSFSLSLSITRLPLLCRWMMVQSQLWEQSGATGNQNLVSVFCLCLAPGSISLKTSVEDLSNSIITERQRLLYSSLTIFNPGSEELLLYSIILSSRIRRIRESNCCLIILTGLSRDWSFWWKMRVQIERTVRLEIWDTSCD